MLERLASRMSVVKASEIREILKVTIRPEVISFAGGLPAPELFPSEKLASLAAAVISKSGMRALQYSPTEGDPQLRDLIAARMSRRSLTSLGADEVLITTGSQQGLDLVGKLFLDPGDAVLCESPTYLGAISAWNVHRPRWIEVATDDEGMVPDDLARLVDSTPHVKVVYTIPNFQNPTGRTWSLPRRRQVMEILAAREIPLVEDNPYGDLRFEGSHLPDMQSMDHLGQVISLRTFSKILCPGLRIAWVAAKRTFLDKLVVLKQGADLHTSTLDQMLVASYLETTDVDQDIARIVQMYRERRDAMLAALSREMPKGVSWTRPCGGLFLWLEFPPQVDGHALLGEALRRDVAFVPGGAFFPNGGRPNYARLNFSNMPIHRIEEGVHRLGTVLTETLAKPNQQTTAIV
jgi:2-aminoadipate transaminase